MLPQQIIALSIIIFLVYRLIVQKNKKEINANEFALWLSLWSVAALSIIFLKKIDLFLASLGLAASAINFLIYLSVLILFYFVFKMRLTIAKQDRELTKLARIVALNNVEDKNKKEDN